LRGSPSATAYPNSGSYTRRTHRRRRSRSTRQLPLRRQLSPLRRTVNARGMIADHYLQLRTDLETALIRFVRLGADLQRSPGSLETLHALLIDIRQPLLFVVVGEVKA